MLVLTSKGLKLNEELFELNRSKVFKECICKIDVQMKQIPFLNLIMQTNYFQKTFFLYCFNLIKNRDVFPISFNFYRYN